MKVVIIDYGSGNVHSALKALQHAASHIDGRAQVTLSDDAQDIARATHIVLPGVGSFAHCMEGLMARKGVIDAMGEAVQARSTPFLGICVGMQLLATRGFEGVEGDSAPHEGLGWIEGEVRKISPHDTQLPIPHMGWNEAHFTRAHPLGEGMMQPARDFYFVHSYAFSCDDKYRLATTDYSGDITAIIARDNIMGVQFHPEKSQDAGLQLLENFLRI